MALTFTQGLLVGQLSVILLIGAFIKFFIFGEAPSRSPRQSKHIRTTSFHSLSPRQSPSHSLRTKASSSNVLRAVPTSATDTASILKKTYYHIPNKRHGKISHNTHQPESLDWFNVLIAQTIAEYRQTAYDLKDSSQGRPGMLASLSAAINNPQKRPSFIDEINITEISLGEEFPIFSNVRVTALEDDSALGTEGRLQALVDVDLSDDNLTLGIDTALILNYPKPMAAILPVALKVSLVRFSGTLSISFVPATEDTPLQKAEGETSSKPKTNLAFSFLPDYRLELSVQSLIGSRSRLQDVPKVAQLVESRIQSWFEERVVEPRVQVVPLPGMWPRMGKTRVREGQEDDRPLSRDGDRISQSQSVSVGQKENFPTQEEAEDMIRGLRIRAPAYRRSSQAVDADDDLRLPGALPA
ncbi:ERMES complex subunit mmm1 [Exophiala xenobiotica]|uniref:Maintenance of mitochondrial morphology protein 1 n=1 Tax=Lithohypha guttulata TaxID=1690604 RepID=A0ABR0KJY0_9EURO|nr:ERMES complex subunit mmm1 [Lithohypha guttulata]KAK5325365.1 ERMES complex subunit mmm1 [Exophiala xenobiotica]